MTTNYEDKLEELGLTEDQLSSALKKKVREFKKLMKEVEELRENVDSGELDEDEQQEAQDSLDEALDNLDELDEALAKEIHVYNRRSQNYKSKKEVKTEEPKKEEPKVETPKTDEPKTDEPKVEAQQGAEVKSADGSSEQKKKSNTPFLLGVLLVALSGGVAWKFLKK